MGDHAPPYIVANDNLGRIPGLVAVAGLMNDHILTVAVSVASGMVAITSAIPSLAPDAVAIGVAQRPHHPDLDGRPAGHAVRGYDRDDLPRWSGTHPERDRPVPARPPQLRLSIHRSGHVRLHPGGDRGNSAARGDTAYNDFPRVLFLLARDFHAPRIFLRMGDRLAFTNGILLLSVAAAAIYLAFGGKTDPLRRALQVSHRPAGCTPLRWRSGQASNDGRCWCGRSEVGLAVR